MPVFAGGAAGLPTLIGPKGGYLVGFLAAGVLLGALASRSFGKAFVTTLIAMVAGNIVIYGCGGIWLAQFTGIESEVNNGVLPFSYGDILKILIAAALLPAAWRILSKFK